MANPALEVDPLRTVAVENLMSPVVDEIPVTDDMAQVSSDDLAYVALERMLEGGIDLWSGGPVSSAHQ